MPLEFQQLTSTISDYIDEVTKFAEDVRTKTEKENTLIASGAYEVAADPLVVYIVPQPKENVPYLSFAPIQNALSELKMQAKAFETAAMNGVANIKNTKELNQLLKDVERILTRTDGLTRRPRFRHHIYAPGFYTGYEVKTLLGLREAIEQRNFEEAN